jgi:uncharacterized paraquat-inducible protein A
MRRKFYITTIFQFIVGFGAAAFIALGLSYSLLMLIAKFAGERSPAFYAVIVISWLAIPVCGIASGYRLAKREYVQHFESARLYTHLCKRCGYDLRGFADIVCPECGTGIPEKQRRHIKEMMETSAN